MKNRTWILIFSGFILLCALIWLLIPKSSGTKIGVWQNGTLLETIDPAVDTVLTVTGPAGSNRIEVKNGSVFVADADCPDQVCVRHGALTPGGLPIICLPNRLVIQWIAPQETGVDAVSGMMP